MSDPPGLAAAAATNSAEAGRGLPAARGGEAVPHGPEAASAKF